MRVTEPDRSGPLFEDDRLKLGLFGFNITAAGALSRSKDRHEISWQQNVDLVRQAEAAGFEAAIPISRWRGFEGETNPWGQSFESYTWASGLAALTERISIFATSHALTMSPLLAAKQIATADHISGGRMGLNVVAGWFEKELRMFTAKSLGHDERYDYLDEWLEVVLRLWERNGVDYAGRHVQIQDGYLEPKPLQNPRPPIMNAAFSPRGHETAAKYADIAFVGAHDPHSAQKQVAEIRKMAASHGRTVQVWAATSVICAETDEAAAALVERYRGPDADMPAVENAVDWTMGAQMTPDLREVIKAGLASTMGGYPLIGSPETIADEIGRMADAGIDGICQTFMNYEAGLPLFVSEILPLLEKKRLRPARAAAAGEGGQA
ncbi:LLM class flavin-dependent oxidoreductase [Nonomuraea diastatica]|uniref:LLM class flavin-dependent oxidoreductase n=1 Tax=Nonomuraea diastatica TaxID=1848329 RepID=UPI001C702DEB|nr:LLM class flavin-dependent oxidoreductase [Nonomuraea diastatica]